MRMANRFLCRVKFRKSDCKFRGTSTSLGQMCQRSFVDKQSVSKRIDDGFAFSQSPVGV